MQPQGHCRYLPSSLFMLVPFAYLVALQCLEQTANGVECSLARLHQLTGRALPIRGFLGTRVLVGRSTPGRQIC